MFGASRHNGLVKSGTGISFSFVQSANSTTASVTVPVQVNNGDIVFLIDRVRTGTTTIPTAVTPAGYTNIYNFGAAGATFGQRYMISYKISSGSEGSVTGMSVTGGAGTKVILIYRPSASPRAVTYTASGAETTDATPANQTLSLGSVVGPYIGVSHYASTSGTISVTPTSGYTRSIAPNATNSYSIWESINSTVNFSNQTITMVDNGSNIMVSGYIQLIA